MAQWVKNRNCEYILDDLCLPIRLSYYYEGVAMDKRPNTIKNRRINYFRRWLAQIVAILGTSLTIMIWYLLVEQTGSGVLFLNTLGTALPWIVLVTGISISLLTGLSVRLTQVTRSRNSSLKRVSEEFQKEIAERIKTEESRQKLEIALLQGQKLQAIGTLAGGIAHDFNNIIYAIKGYTEMAREDMVKDSIAYNNLGKVLEAAQRGQDLVASILAFGRSQKRHEHQPLNIKTTLENVLSLLKPTIPSSVTINLIGVSNNHMILADQTQLHQVIVNIVNNAVDAMDGEGIITIEVSHIHINDDDLARLPTISKKDYCKIDISDTGHGMDQDTMKRIYEPFYTTKEVGKGTGLGLSTVHTIIKEHEGDISVTSQLGKGTTFTLLLPELNHANGE
jgi:signal transduction histidine kinase